MLAADHITAPCTGKLQVLMKYCRQDYRHALRGSLVKLLTPFNTIFHSNYEKTDLIDISMLTTFVYHLNLKKIEAI